MKTGVLSPDFEPEILSPTTRGPDPNGDVAELADALDLGSSVPRTCRFDSCHPHFEPGLNSSSIK